MAAKKWFEECCVWDNARKELISKFPSMATIRQYGRTDSDYGKVHVRTIFVDEAAIQELFQHYQSCQSQLESCRNLLDKIASSRLVQSHVKNSNREE